MVPVPMYQTSQIVERAKTEAAAGKKVLVLVTSQMQERALRNELPDSVEFATKAPSGKRYDVVLDDR